MPKTAPSPARVLTMVVFALSCFGLLLFLWLSFGGAVPLKPKGYRFDVGFAEATQLAEQADVRIAGVSVGKVVAKDLDEEANRTLATIELDERFAPVTQDTKAMLRQKTLLGETYVELTTGTPSSPPVPEGGRLADGQVRDAVELDEIFSALDPKTRAAFGQWQQQLAKAIDGRGRDLNDALGNLPVFVEDGGDLLAKLDRQERSVQRLVRNTGVVFGALSENEAQLRNLITNAADVFRATASQNEALAETFRIFPTFLDESRLTVQRLETFSRDTRPLIADLRPALQDLQPALGDLQRLAPDLENFYRDLDPVITTSRTGIPATEEFLRATPPVLGETASMLGELNPLLGWLEQSQHQVSDFISQGGAAIADTTVSAAGLPGHYLRQFGPSGAESAGIYRRRLPNNRGNSYLNPGALSRQKNGEFQIFPNFDCRPSGGEQKPKSPREAPLSGSPACFVARNLTFQNELKQHFPHVKPVDYGRPGS